MFTLTATAPVYDFAKYTWVAGQVTVETFATFAELKRAAMNEHGIPAQAFSEGRTSYTFQSWGWKWAEVAACPAPTRQGARSGYRCDAPATTDGHCDAHTPETHDECGKPLADHCTECDECPRTDGPCWCATSGEETVAATEAAHPIGVGDVCAHASSHLSGRLVEVVSFYNDGVHVLCRESNGRERRLLVSELRKVTPAAPERCTTCNRRLEDGTYCLTSQNP